MNGVRKYVGNVRMRRREAVYGWLLILVEGVVKRSLGEIVWGGEMSEVKFGVWVEVRNEEVVLEWI